jgi:hypothetical protein
LGRPRSRKSLSHIGLFLKKADLPAILRVDKNVARFVSRKEAGPEQLHAGSEKRAHQKRHMPPALSSTAEPTHNSIANSRKVKYNLDPRNVLIDPFDRRARESAGLAFCWVCEQVTGSVGIVYHRVSVGRLLFCCPGPFLENGLQPSERDLSPASRDGTEFVGFKKETFVNDEASENPAGNDDFEIS